MTSPTTNSISSNQFRYQPFHSADDEKSSTLEDTRPPTSLNNDSVDQKSSTPRASARKITPAAYPTKIELKKLEAIDLFVAAHKEEWEAAAKDQTNDSKPLQSRTWTTYKPFDSKLPWTLKVSEGGRDVIALTSEIVGRGSWKIAFKAFNCLTKERVVLLRPLRKKESNWDTKTWIQATRDFQNRELPKFLKFRCCTGIVDSFGEIPLEPITNGNAKTPSIEKGILLPYCDSTLTDLTKAIKNNRDRLARALRHNLRDQLVQGLYHLHNNGIVHHDISPRNILISKSVSGKPINAMLTDFGSARDIKDRTLFSDNQISQDVAPPETLYSEARTFSDLKAMDVWSLGCILYELELGLRPYWTVNQNSEADAYRNELTKLSKLAEPQIKVGREFAEWRANLAQDRSVTLQVVSKMLHPHEKKRISIEQVMRAFGLMRATNKTAVASLEGKVATLSISSSDAIPASSPNGQFQLEASIKPNVEIPRDINTDRP